MPRVVRNFWAEVDVDGRESTMAGGPRAKDGGLDITLYQRSAGCVTTALTVRCYTGCDGNLITSVRDCNGKEITRIVTNRTHSIVEEEIACAQE